MSNTRLTVVVDGPVPLNSIAQLLRGAGIACLSHQTASKPYALMLGEPPEAVFTNIILPEAVASRLCCKHRGFMAGKEIVFWRPAAHARPASA